MNSLFSRKSDANTINELVQVSADAALHSISCQSVVNVVYVFFFQQTHPLMWVQVHGEKKIQTSCCGLFYQLYLVYC